MERGHIRPYGKGDILVFSLLQVFRPAMNRTFELLRRHIPNKWDKTDTYSEKTARLLIYTISIAV